MAEVGKLGQVDFSITERTEKAAHCTDFSVVGGDWVESGSSQSPESTRPVTRTKRRAGARPKPVEVSL